VTWRDDLKRVVLPNGKRLIGASFRGIPFLVEASERVGGRRTVAHEFPLRDDPYIEDLGRKARTFRVDGYVVGDDYVQQRDDLLSALEDISGPGELVHPYHGTRRAVCSSVSVRETKADGGLAAFAIEFAEAPAQSLTPTEVPYYFELVDESATAAKVATRAELVERYNAGGMPSFGLASAERALTRAAAAVRTKLAPVVRITQDLARLNRQVERLTSEASSLIREPGDVLDAFEETLAALAATAEAAPGRLWEAFMDAYGEDLESLIPETTATRARERDNADALIAALKRILVIEAARVLPRATFATLEEAIADRDAVAALLDEQAGEAGDTAYPALVDLRAQVVRAVPGDAVLASILTVERNVPIPSLILSYQLYGSVDQEGDILARNNASHPGFISGTLQVLSNV